MGCLPIKAYVTLAILCAVAGAVLVPEGSADKTRLMAAAIGAVLGGAALPILRTLTELVIILTICAGIALAGYLLLTHGNF